MMPKNFINALFDKEIAHVKYSINLSKNDYELAE